jgi:uncharacterized protein
MKTLFFAAAVALQLSACAGDPSVKLAGKSFVVEIAQDDASRSKGLMFREQMDPDRGMLFIFSDQANRSFWMHHCKISLDILYFDKDRVLVGQALSVPPCNLPPEQCPNYASGAPSKYVLELNAGTAQSMGVKLGDVMSFSGVTEAPR